MRGILKVASGLSILTLLHLMRRLKYASRNCRSVAMSHSEGFNLGLLWPVCSEDPTPNHARELPVGRGMMGAVAACLTRQLSSLSWLPYSGGAERTRMKNKHGHLFLRVQWFLILGRYSKPSHWHQQQTEQTNIAQAITRVASPWYCQIPHILSQWLYL